MMAPQPRVGVLTMTAEEKRRMLAAIFDTVTSSSAGGRRRRWRPSAKSDPDTEQRRATLTVSVQEYDIADVRPVFGKEAE